MLISEFLAELAEVTCVQVVYFQEAARRRITGPQVYIGCGRWEQSGETPMDNSIILVTNKGTAKRFTLRADYTSVTKFVAAPPEGYLESFELWAQRPVAPIAALSAMTIIADDASPDSTFATVLLLAHLAKVDLAEFPSSWIDSVDRWETTGLSRNPERSWCVLESSLTHRSFPLAEELSSEHLSQSWLDALHFAAECLARKLDPERISELPNCTEYVEAQAALEQEREVYRAWLERASPIQVSLPLHGTADREMLADGLLIESRQVTGTTKVFFRSDREHSPLKKGFPFAAICSPNKGGGEIDITISVDPSRGLELRTLWLAIEEAESEAWKRRGLSRPQNRPRSMQGTNNIYNEPWYINSDATLIGRPYQLQDGSPGSLLTWDEVREVIWRQLNPLRSVRAQMLGTGKTVPILELEPESRHAKHDKLFFAAKWLGSENDDSLAIPPQSSPAFSRTIAGLLKRGRASTALTFADLPGRSDSETLRLTSGLAVLTLRGIVILDDASAESLDIDALRQDFHLAAELDDRLNHAETHRVRSLAQGVRSLLRRAKGAKGPDQLLIEAALLSAELAEMKGNLAMLPGSTDARSVRLAIERHWSLDRRLSACESEAAKIESSLRSLNELRTLEIGRFIATYGFAIVLASSVAPILAKAYFHWRHGGADVDAPGRIVAVWFAALAILLAGAVWTWFRRADPIGRRRP